MKVEVTNNPKNTVKLGDLQPGECAWVRRDIYEGAFNILVMRLGYENGIKSYVALETGFTPGPDHYFYNECLDWECVPVNVKVVRI